MSTTYSKRVGESKLEALSDGMRHLRRILLLSPDTFATGPGLIMTLFAFVLWTLSGLAVQGPLSWVAMLVAGVISVIGPIVYCTGLAIRYRAESLGLRHSPLKHPLAVLIRRFFLTGVTLMMVTVLLVVVLVINFHRHPNSLSVPVDAVLASVTRSAAILGIVLLAAPVLSPFLTASPMRQLPRADEEA